MNETTHSQSQLSEDSNRLLLASILANLKMTPEERIEAHENALQLMTDLAEAGKALRAAQSQSVT
jgi:hypothetical protein